MDNQMQLMPRPKTTTPGNIPLTTNLLEMTVKPNLTLHHYTVTFEPEIARRVYPLIIQTITQRNENFTGDPTLTFGYDGGSMLATNKKLKTDVQETEKVGLNEVTVRIEYKKTYGLEEATGRQCLEIMMRSYQAEKFFVDGRKVVSQRETSTLTGGIELWHGLSQRVKYLNSRVFLNVDVVFTPFYETLPLVDLVVKLCQRRRNEPVDLRRLDNRKFLYLAKFLKGVRLSTAHRERNFTFTPHDITDTAATDTFFGDEPIAVSDYFAKQYAPLKHPYLPCVVVKKKDGNIFFPLEVLRVPAAQKYARKLSDAQTAEVIKLSAKPAAERFRCLEGRIESLAVCRNEVLQRLECTVSSHFFQCMGRQLQAPDVRFCTEKVQPVRGSWNLRNHRVVRGVAVLRWTVLVLADEKVSYVNSQMQNLVRICNEMGLKMASPLEVRSVTLNNIEEHIKGKELAVVILQDKSSSVYQEVKRIADVNCSVVTQCIRKQNVEKLRDGSFCGNICLKINTKLGGVNFTVNIAEEECVVFGADVTHPGFGDMSSCSIAAVVSSLDKDLSRYHTSLRMQPKRQDIIEDLAAIVKSHLVRFRANTRKTPKKIIFFRDGVGDTLIETVYFREIETIREACGALHAGYRPALTFVVVQKRHSVRFKGDGRTEHVRDPRRGPSCNPLPGTLVDSVGTVHNDFYMISHYALQGTPCPIKYHVLVDENNIQNFPSYIYAMCHVFTRATKSVSVVPPVYYAHLAAARAKCYVEDDKLMDVDDKLKDVLYYL